MEACWKNTFLVDYPTLSFGLSLTLHLTEGCSPNSIPLYIATQSLSADGETGIGIGSTFYGFD